MLRPPVLDADRYGRLLGDSGFWRPYAEEALRRCGIPTAGLTSGFPGTYPTLLGDRWVVKLFGFFGDWRSSLLAEHAAGLAVAADPRILAPRLVATGSLFPGEDDDWPFLISTRVSGTAWRDAGLAPQTARRLAADLGGRVRRVHRCPVPEGLRMLGDRLATHGSGAAGRQRRWASLPPGLLDQVDEYLAGFRPAGGVLVHGDLTEDHLFVDRGQLVGIIDWGDAMITDPYYELGALHLGAFRADRSLLAAFLDGYGWSVEDDFADRAMRTALMHRFDLFGQIADRLADADTLPELARMLWAA